MFLPNGVVLFLLVAYVGTNYLDAAKSDDHNKSLADILKLVSLFYNYYDYKINFFFGQPKSRN